MKQKILEFYNELDKAVDRAVWLQFKHRLTRTRFVVYDGPESNYAVSDLKTAQQMGMAHHFYPLVKSYKNLSYDKLKSISDDWSKLVHWEELLGKFTVMEGELLRFIINYQIPVEKLIRQELASRGFDQNQQWVGFDAAKEIWLK